MKKLSFSLSLVLLAVMTFPFANTAAASSATFSLTIGHADIQPAPPATNTLITYQAVFKNTSLVNSDVNDPCYFMFTTEDGTLAPYSEDWFDVPTVMTPNEEFEFTLLVPIESSMPNGTSTNSMEIYNCDDTQIATATFEYRIGE